MKHDVHALTAIGADIEKLAVANQIEFVFNGKIVAGHGDNLIVDPSHKDPIQTTKDGKLRVYATLAEEASE